MKLTPEYIVDERGEKKAVVLPIGEYERLLEAAEDHLDAQDLDEAVETETDFVPYDQVREQLRREGKL